MSIKVEGDEVVVRLSLDEWGDLHYSLGAVQANLRNLSFSKKQPHNRYIDYQESVKNIDKITNKLRGGFLLNDDVILLVPPEEIERTHNQLESLYKEPRFLWERDGAALKLLYECKYFLSKKTNKDIK